MHVSKRSSLCTVSLIAIGMLSVGCISAPEDEAEAEASREVSILAIPAPPASISAETHECYGWNTISWSVSSGATYYELHRISPQPRLVYSGSGDSHSISVGTQSARFAAKACNSEGCSALNSGVTAFPWRTCH